ncbi:hypothetical protein EYF80_032678 [Liparis tanakae]|uniref:Uncharacterized protein n=1 Tax=Liparis tanakae TaxID=230148 RepID=A0A4Z2GWE6_9TELE|nr:hypothetical protein EYF80_032678 [Liparis tanakae]
MAAPQPAHTALLSSGWDDGPRHTTGEWCRVDGSRALKTTKEPDCVPATSQSHASPGIWTVTRHETGPESISCRRERGAV